MPEPVNLKIGSYPFACYPLANASFINIAAVYVILCVGQTGSWTVLDVGQSGELGERIDNHSRKDSWFQHCANKNIWVCVYPAPISQYTKEQRVALEASLRAMYKPPCGER
jgi:hypothetical protein